MRRDDLLDVLNRIPPGDLTVTVLILRSGMITIDTVLRAEDEYVVIRGREGGTTDEGRAFFVPYAEVVYVKLDKILKAADVQKMYAGPEAEPPPASAVTQTPAPPETRDPAAIAKQNLLDRIRAARTAGASPAAAISAPRTPK